MSLYEIALLGAALFSIFAFLGMASMLLDSGSFRVVVGFGLAALVSAGIAHQVGAEGIVLADIVSVLAKLVEMVRTGG